MKKTLLLALGIVMCASLAFGQAGHVGLYTDLGTFANCNLLADVGLINVYVVHQATAGAKAVQYQVVQVGGPGMIWLADVNQFPLNIGNTQTGMATSYGGCLASPIHTTTILYQGIGIAPVCSSLDVGPDPILASGNIEGSDCLDQLTNPTGGVLSIKDDGTCPCVVATEETNWGKIKSLYN